MPDIILFFCYHRKTQLLEDMIPTFVLMQDTFLFVFAQTLTIASDSLNSVNTVPGCNTVCRFTYGGLKSTVSSPTQLIGHFLSPFTQP